MKKHEIGLALSGRAFLEIDYTDYICIGGCDEEGYRFANSTDDSWALIMTYDQMLENDLTIRIREDCKLTNFGAMEAYEYYINSLGYNFYCVIGNYLLGSYITIINWGVTAHFVPNSTVSTRISLTKACFNNKYITDHFSKEEIHDIIKDITESLPTIVM